MAEDKYLTILQEMEALGIEPRYFDTLYNQLKKSQQLPSGDIVPWGQYTTIVDYLRDKHVLGEDNKIQAEGLKVFDSRRELETMLDPEDLFELEDIGSSGGLAACTYDYESSGGLVPCRY